MRDVVVEAATVEIVVGGDGRYGRVIEEPSDGDDGVDDFVAVTLVGVTIPSSALTSALESIPFPIRPTAADAADDAAPSDSDDASRLFTEDAIELFLRGVVIWIAMIDAVRTGEEFVLEIAVVYGWRETVGTAGHVPEGSH
eukprot:CAMPEP_0196244988 /NCGR_PEP_ID=MMETSP0913-20130531/32047_1 /TAXON_ID=49265 /ORGANISM="Thalassiosira rotula, Strain GSO102" /LENGTH=140 /DNA_ID=CAMNT_0041529097 /DNA_START=114 /DNA_END=536 /DNA_ORIENTATION=+